jgi:CRP/FNR family transcriptional regulator, cyclic AMP receptor protein
METLEEMIIKQPFWTGLNPHYFHLLKDCATFERFWAGTWIFRERQEARHFYLIQTGRVRLEAFVPGRGTVTVQTISAGEALGWSWLFPPYQWHFAAYASETTELIAFNARFLRDRAEQNHDFGYELIKRVSNVLLQRLQQTRLLLVDFYGLPD